MKELKITTFITLAIGEKCYETDRSKVPLLSPSAQCFSEMGGQLTFTESSEPSSI